MGWKTLKERFAITHIVQVAGDQINIGSGYIPTLVQVNIKTGMVSEDTTFTGFLRDHCPSLKNARTEEVLKAINATDEFSASIKVFTYNDAEIVEKLCEEVGYPNVTHDGLLMHDNTYSTDRATVVRWAKENLELSVKWRGRQIAEAEVRLAQDKTDLAKAMADLTKLKAENPEPAEAASE